MKNIVMCFSKLLSITAFELEKLLSIRKTTYYSEGCWNCSYFRGKQYPQFLPGTLLTILSKETSEDFREHPGLFKEL